MHLSPENALGALRERGGLFAEVFAHGSLSLEIYRPEGQDLQNPHTRDEVYIVIAGTGIFQQGSVQHPFAPGDFLFVPAGVSHRFLEFTPDFATWVLFYGPEGGERA